MLKTKWKTAKWTRWRARGKMKSKMKDGVEMKEGKVMVMKGANTMELKENLVLKDSLIFAISGSVN